MPLLALGCSGCHLPSGGKATKRCCASTTRAGLATSYDVGSGTAGAGFSFSWNRIMSDHLATVHGTLCAQGARDIKCCTTNARSTSKMCGRS